MKTWMLISFNAVLSPFLRKNQSTHVMWMSYSLLLKKKQKTVESVPSHRDALFLKRILSARFETEWAQTKAFHSFITCKNRGSCSIWTNQTHNFSLDLTNQLVIRLTNSHRPLTQYTYWVPVCLWMTPGPWLPWQPGHFSPSLNLRKDIMP